MKYFNMKTNYGVETVDYLCASDFSTYSEYKKELLRLVNEYRLCGMNVYLSQKEAK